MFVVAIAVFCALLYGKLYSKATMVWMSVSPCTCG